MYLAKINYKKENVVQVLSSIIKDVIDENTVIVCIGTDRAIGDALGVPVEFYNREALKKNPVTKMGGGGSWGQPSGTWSDDTSMMIATIDAMNQAGCTMDGSEAYNIDLLATITMQNFGRWYKGEAFSCSETRFDVGGTCERAIKSFLDNEDVHTCGVTDPNCCGNGSLMRILPLAFSGKETTLAVSSLTHNNELCNFLCLLYCTYIKLIILDVSQNKQKLFEQALRMCMNKSWLDVYNTLKDEQSILLYNNISDIPEHRVKSSGYALHALEAAIWCFITTDNFRDAVLKAVNLGDDTDTVACITGGLAGIYYGLDDIPLDWKNEIRGLDKIHDVCYDVS